MPYLNIVTNEYPRHNGDLELMGWSVGEDLPPNWVEILFVEPPTVEDGTTYFEISPKKVQGVWTMQWDTRPLTTEELEQASLEKE